MLFLDPDSYETVLTLDGFAPRVHELLVAPDRAIAYVPKTGAIGRVIEVGSNKTHRMEMLPDGSKLYTETEENPFASVVDLATRKRRRTICAPNGLAGLAYRQTAEPSSWWTRTSRRLWWWTRLPTRC